MEAVWQMFIGVQGQLPAEECIRLLTRADEVGSSDRVDTTFRLVRAGLRFAHDPRPPRALPTSPNLIDFQINRESELGERQDVQRSLTLAIRLNENLIVGNIQGQRVLTIKSEGQTTPLEFTLYVVPPVEKRPTSGARRTRKTCTRVSPGSSIRSSPRGR